MGFFSKKIRVGIDLGSESIKIIGLKQSANKIDIQFYELINLIEQYSLQSAKDVTDEHYIEQLRLLAVKYKLKNKEITVALPSHASLLRSVEIGQSLTDREIADTIQTEVEQTSISGVQNMRIACHQSESFDGSMLVCAIPNEQLERCTKILDSAGLDVIIVGIDAFEILNSFNYFHEKKLTSPITVIHTGTSHTICINISKNADPFFHIFTVDEEESGNVGSEEKIIEMGEIEHLGGPPYPDLDLLKTRWSGRSDTISDFETQLVKEIKKYRNHLQTCQGPDQVGPVYLTGDLTNASHLPAALRNSFNAEVIVWNPFDEFGDLTVSKSLGQQFPAAIGSAIKEVQ